MPQSAPLISSSILGTYQPGEFIFQFSIFLPLHTLHGFLKVGILKWFAIPFSVGPHFFMSGKCMFLIHFLSRHNNDLG